MTARRAITRLQDADDLAGSAGTGKGWVRNAAGAMEWTDLATQDELAGTQNSHVVGGYYGTAVAITNAVMTLDRLTAFPIPVRRGRTFDRIGCEPFTVSAGALVRLGLYAPDADGFPGALILDAGTVDVGSTGGLKEITISYTSTHDVLWLAAAMQVAAVSMFSLNSGAVMHYPLVKAQGSYRAFVHGVRRAPVSGALPDPFGVGVANAVEDKPIAVWLRAA